MPTSWHCVLSLFSSRAFLPRSLRLGLLFSLCLLPWSASMVALGPTPASVGPPSLRRNTRFRESEALPVSLPTTSAASGSQWALNID